MDEDQRPQRARQRRQGAARPSGSCGQPSGSHGGHRGSVAERTARRTFLALGTYAAQELRDPDGMARPLLRRAAVRLTLSTKQPARRLGRAYLRLDPPTPEELGGPPRVIAVDGMTEGPRLLPAADEQGAAARSDDGPW
jgi:hypothetical protein